jgi:hypothetical protein
MKSQKIDDIRKQFHHEWLLIGVDQMDETTTTVLAGHLLAHSPSYDEIYKIADKYPGQHLMTVYSEDWPEDLAAAF